VTADLEPLDVRTRAAWRAWLEKHHAASPGVWLVLHKAHTGVQAIPHEHVTREALCFGWIDSLVKRLDEDRYAVKLTPRKPTSKWSDINRRHYAELKAEGLLAAAGLAAAPTGRRYASKPAIPSLPAYIATALKANAKAWNRFELLPARERRNFVVWIHTAKRPETRERRINESIALLRAGRKLGLR